MAKSGLNALTISLCAISICFVIGVRSQLTLQVVYDTLNYRLDNLDLKTFHLKSNIEAINTRMDKFEASIDQSCHNNEDGQKKEIIKYNGPDYSKFALLKAFESEKKVIRQSLNAYNDNLVKIDAVLKEQLELMKRLVDNSVQQFDDKFEMCEKHENDSRLIRRSVTHLERNISQVQKSVTDFVDDSENEFVNIKDKLVDLKQNYDESLQSTSTKIQGFVNEITININTLSYRTDAIEESIKRLKDTLSYRTDAIGESISRRKDKSQVGFNVQLSQFKRDLPKAARIVFDNLICNYGDGYNKNTGIFTAPVAGLYLFHYNIQPCTGKIGHVLLIVDGRIKSSAVADTDEYSTGSNSAVTRMRVGDVAYVRTGSLRDMYCFSHYQTSFAGALISL